MSQLTLLLCVALSMPPSPPRAGGVSAAKMAAQPLPDNELAQGTVSVLVRKGKGGAENAEVWMLPATSSETDKPALDSALAGNKTNAEGRVYLKAAAFSGRQVVVWVKIGDHYQRSVPFQIPVLGGVRLLFLASGAAPHGASGTPASDPDDHVGHDHGQGPVKPKGPTTSDPSHLQLWVSFRVMAIEAGDVYLAVTYSVVNRGRQTFYAGDHGLLLPMPGGAKGIGLPRGTRDASVHKKGILALRPVPTGRHGLRIQASCKLPYDRPERLVRLRSFLPIIGYSVSLQKYRTVRIGGADLESPESFNHGETSTPWLVYRSLSKGFPRNEITFQVQGLPVRSRAGAWLFAGLALLLVLGALGLTVARGRGPRAGSPGAADPADTLVHIERDRLLGVIDDAQAREYALAALGHTGRRRQPSPGKRKKR